MWGMIAKITTNPGKREEMIAILQGSAAGLPGCLSYVVAADAAQEDVLWVTEVWASQADHDASLTLRQVQDAVPRARPLVAKFDRVAVTRPAWGPEFD
jgi:quinol monooxygenase YgiN